MDFASRLSQVSASLQTIAASPYIDAVAHAVELLAATTKAGNKVLVFGNGGSAADAQHIAAELVGRFARSRAPLAAIALGTNAAYLTAWSNDEDYDGAFARELEAVGKTGDVAWGISTSGRSKSVVVALRTARALGLRTIALTGDGGGDVAQFADVLLAVPLTETARIQEIHLITYHHICAALERTL
jgi:D-sedoheptulose 7-phosphate isomerase